MKHNLETWNDEIEWFSKDFNKTKKERFERFIRQVIRQTKKENPSVLGKSNTLQQAWAVTSEHGSLNSVYIRKGEAEFMRSIFKAGGNKSKLKIIDVGIIYEHKL